jgi:hypothetical protein
MFRVSVDFISMSVIAIVYSFSTVCILIFNFVSLDMYRSYDDNVPAEESVSIPDPDVSS